MNGSHPIDRHVGQRLRLARRMKRLSQTALADAVGLTFQQIQKYEKGANRISASRLFQFAEVVGVEVPFFFQGTEQQSAVDGDIGARFIATDAGVPRPTQLDREIMEKLSAIKDATLKRMIIDLINCLGASGGVEATSPWADSRFQQFEAAVRPDGHGPGEGRFF